ncbi:tRNA-dihydrouridine(20/20a) synthase-like [Dioscorea cayenensis subsp. rotundata]|uniref:tRNA-dihydrouridine(20/20a) synthase-like n=1 Tax=Dioscorea cayennensis subsp. rotundata TaxID=55577 RepID=A0AB40B1A0_DIOCR|nr:tRNA-dihydrouridine(20/20a) synthase-like [Dioscorea cayenensis subsp. rotundata]
MMKYARHNLLSSLVPLQQGSLNHHHSQSIGRLRTFSSQFRRFNSSNGKGPIFSEKDKVNGQYPPPWFSVAPMMDWTDNHYRFLARLISKRAWLFTEMVVAETIVHQKDNLDRFLAFPPEQHPIVLQIGGSNLDNLAKAAELANAYDYDEINLNCGCPSGKVAGHGCFGARLMFDPKFVGDAMSTIATNCDAPVSVKCRIGVDDRDSYNELCEFVYTVSSKSPTKHFIIHARKALLNGLSPAENRTIPPLKYEYYFALLRDFPDLQFTLNGGITCIDQVAAARRQGAHNVMVGRAAYNNPWHMLGHVDSAIYGLPPSVLSRRQVLEQFQIYGDSILKEDGRKKPNVRQLVKPLLNLFHGERGNGLWKRKADTALHHCTTMKSFLEETLSEIPDTVLDSVPERNTPESDGDFVDLDGLLPPPYRCEQQLHSLNDQKASPLLCTA